MNGGRPTHSPSRSVAVAETRAPRPELRQHSATAPSTQPTHLRWSTRVKLAKNLGKTSLSRPAGQPAQPTHNPTQRVAHGQSMSRPKSGTPIRRPPKRNSPKECPRCSSSGTTRPRLPEGGLARGPATHPNLKAAENLTPPRHSGQLRPPLGLAHAELALFPLPLGRPAENLRAALAALPLIVEQRPALRAAPILELHDKRGAGSGFHSE